MLRLATTDGWWLVTHPDHAHLAGQFAAQWGNALFAPPEPREHVLRGIFAHDDGWQTRDAQTPITREGKPAAFSSELVGKYSAFEEIDLEAYLNVRRSAVQLMAADDPYAAILISMHTHNLLSERADHSTIPLDQLPLLDAFLTEQLELQKNLRQQLLDQHKLPPQQLQRETLLDNFRLLQAVDNLSLLSCVDFDGEATLLHPLRTRDGDSTEVKVQHLAERTFRLCPNPLCESKFTFHLRARFVFGLTFKSSDDLRERFSSAPVEELVVTISD